MNALATSTRPTASDPLRRGDAVTTNQIAGELTSDGQPIPAGKIWRAIKVTKKFTTMVDDAQRETVVNTGLIRKVVA